MSGRFVSTTDEVYRELFRVVDRATNEDGKPVSRGVHRLRVLAVIMAREWAKVAGIKFKWLREPPHVTCADCGAQSEIGVTACPVCGDHDVHEMRDTWRCQASLKGEPLSWEGEWDFGDGPPSARDLTDRALMLFGEGRISQLFMMQVGTGWSRDEHDNARFLDSPDGRIVFTE